MFWLERDKKKATWLIFSFLKGSALGTGLALQLTKPHQFLLYTTSRTTQKKRFRYIWLLHDTTNKASYCPGCLCLYKRMLHAKFKAQLWCDCFCNKYFRAFIPRGMVSYRKPLWSKKFLNFLWPNLHSFSEFEFFRTIKSHSASSLMVKLCNTSFDESWQ